MIGRALLLTALGMVACSGLLVANLVIVLHGFIAGQPIQGRDWLAVFVFAVLPLVVLGIGGRAFLRERRRRNARGARRHLALAAPVLAGLGVVLGLLAGVPLSRGRVSSLNAIDHRICERVEAGAIERCLPLARTCRARFEHHPGTPGEQLAVVRSWPRRLPMPRSPRERLELLCILDGLGGR